MVMILPALKTFSGLSQGPIMNNSRIKPRPKWTRSIPDFDQANPNGPAANRRQVGHDQRLPGQLGTHGQDPGRMMQTAMSLMMSCSIKRLSAETICGLKENLMCGRKLMDEGIIPEPKRARLPRL
jgi:hypothetical protein